MGFLSAFLIVVFIVAAILLVAVILIQDEQGEGLGGIFGGGSATPFGSRSGNVLTRFTTILGAIFLFCSFGIAWANRSTQSGDVVAAAKRQESQSTEWWNTPVNSNEQLPGSSSGSPAGSGDQGAADTTNGAAGSTSTQSAGASTAAGANGSSGTGGAAQ